MAVAAAAAGEWMTGGVGPLDVSASASDSFLLAELSQRLLRLVQAGPQHYSKEFAHCCLSLAKYIDFAIAKNQVPTKPPVLPLLLKQVCQCHRSNADVKPAIMVLMIAVKNACQLGWFLQEESRELLALADEIGNCFHSLGGISPSLTSPGSPFSQIMERFYPFLKLGYVIGSVEVKPGFATLVTDFHISGKMLNPLHEKVRLFVVQKDNIQTSSCITNPPHVSILLNGKGVEKRTNVSMDSGPQLPTIVNRMLRYGTNLLQAIGHFSGPYIIVLAFTCVIPPPDTPLLKDYVQTGVIESNSDSDIIEGPSRISLNCPISRTRIKLPVKGHLCKHLQCFDFGNYVNINMRRPSWRCPHCHQPVCYTDIRVDQHMVKVLKEVGYNATDVIISTNGSWKVVMENDEDVEPVHDASNDPEDSTSFLNAGPTFFDLTGDDDEMGTFDNTDVEDQKPLWSDLQHQSAATNSRTPSNNVNNAAPNADFSSAFLFSNGITPDSALLNRFSAPSNIALQSAQSLNAAIGQEYTNLSQVLRTRDPVAIQAMHAPPQDRPPSAATMSSEPIPTAQSSQFQVPSVMPLGHCILRTSDPLERWHQISGANQIPHQTPATSSSQTFTAIQGQNRHSRIPSPGQLRSPPTPQPSLPQAQTLCGLTIGQQTRSTNVGQTPTQMVNQQRLNNPGGGAVQSVFRVSDLVNLTPDSNWRSQGRMRGSIVPGSSPSLDHVIIRPTQQSQTARPLASQPVRVPLTQTVQSPVPYLPAHLASRTHELNVPQMQTSSSSVCVPPGFSGTTAFQNPWRN